jgi:aryl-alcohol dehydrogenase-like predicted oxidoreductase
MFGTALDQQRTNAVLDRFAALGGNFIDTARMYGDWVPNIPLGASERAIGAWLKGRKRESIVIATKGAGFDMRARDWKPRVTPECVERDLRESLEHLGTGYLDLYWLHADDPTQPVKPLIDALAAHQGLESRGTGDESRATGA